MDYNYPFWAKNGQKMDHDGPNYFKVEKIKKKNFFLKSKTGNVLERSLSLSKKFLGVFGSFPGSE